MSAGKGYHPFVFDTEKRAFLGRFEEMYRAEAEQRFDSWHQEDQRVLDKQICRALLERRCFAEVLDLGCGKGAFTQFLKKADNRVLALDISETALEVARGRFPDIDFAPADAGATDFSLPRLAATRRGGRFDLVVCCETLSYLRNWREIIRDAAQCSEYMLVALYIPEHPIGFVKSPAELMDAFNAHFAVEEAIQLLRARKVILFGKTLIAQHSIH